MDLEELIRRAQGGEREALDAIFREYYPAVLGLVKARMGRFLRAREESEDVAQSVFRQALESGGFEKAVFDSPERLRSWLLRIAENKLTDHVRTWGARKRGAGETVALGPLEDSGSASGGGGALPDAAATSPTRFARDHEDLERIRGSLERLPSREHRDVVRLHFFEGLDTAEIGRRLALEPRAVRRLRAESVALLAGLLGDAPSGEAARSE
jgi:RNA polymerase sigma factor (sigma-70 family)